MQIKDFFSNYSNHPVLFVGTGISLRYLDKAYTWDNLLRKISLDLFENDEKYLDIKSKYLINKKCNFSQVAMDLEKVFNEKLAEDRNGKFKNINDIFYKKMNEGENISKFKIYISEILKDAKINELIAEELKSFKKIKKNIASIITTNYDTFLDGFFDFKPLIGNDILLSNPYGSIYKIHGCVCSPKDIIITKNDYELFDKKFELIRAQLLSIFMNNPIVFLGYNVGDDNIVKLLETIFSYVDENTKEADKIRSNFLLVEYEKDSKNLEVSDHDIRLNDKQTIRINKIKTDDFISIYENLANLQIKISAMDIRKVQNIVKEIYKNGDIRVEIVENIDDLQNKDKVLAIGSKETVKYTYKQPKEFIEEYFKIIDEENLSLISVIDKFSIQSSQHFPIFGFFKLYPSLGSAETLIKNQIEKINHIVKSIKEKTHRFNTIHDILSSNGVSKSNQWMEIYMSVYNNDISLIDFENYLKTLCTQPIDSYFRKLLCLYDYKKYSAI